MTSLMQIKLNFVTFWQIMQQSSMLMIM